MSQLNIEALDSTKFRKIDTNLSSNNPQQAITTQEEDSIEISLEALKLNIEDQARVNGPGGDPPPTFP